METFLFGKSKNKGLRHRVLKMVILGPSMGIHENHGSILKIGYIGIFNHCESNVMIYFSNFPKFLEGRPFCYDLFLGFVLTCQLYLISIIEKNIMDIQGIWVFMAYI